MNDFLSPACLLLALVLFISGFAALTRERPQPGMELHRARVENDEQYRDLLEQQLARKRLQRLVLIFSLFGMAILMAITGFAVMRPAESR